MSTIQFIGLIFIIFMLYGWLKKDQLKEGASENKNNENENIDEERVFKVQTKFEEELGKTYLPDAISGSDVYIYKNLMLGWYDKLSGKNRYDDKMTQKLRTDWLDYMSSLEDRSTYNYLWLEEKNEDIAKKHREDHVTASRKVFAIEDAFAAAVGESAVKELARIRATDSWGFDESGNMVPAPEGHEYDHRSKKFVTKKK